MDNRHFNGGCPAPARRHPNFAGLDFSTEEVNALLHVVEEVLMRGGYHQPGVVANGTRYVVLDIAGRDKLYESAVVKVGDEVFVINEMRSYVLNPNKKWELQESPIKLEEVEDLEHDEGASLLADRAIADENGRRIIDEYITYRAAKGYLTQVYNQLFTENPPHIMEGYITADMLSDSVKDLLGSMGNVVNLPDEEDLTKRNGVLKLADKRWNPNQASGMGRKMLRRNMVNGVNVLTQDMMSEENTIYIIQYDFDLQDAEITIPENCVLQFEGGSLSCGTIVGVKCLSAPLKRIFNNISFVESHVDKWDAEWFGDVINDFPSTYQHIENSLPEHSSVYVNNNITFGDTINILKRINLFFLDITFTSNNKDVFVYGNKSNGITDVTFKANNIRYNLLQSDNVYAQTNAFLKLKSCSFCCFDFHTCSNIGIPIYFYPEGSCGQNIFRFNKILNGNKGVYFSNGISTNWDNCCWCEGNQFYFGFIVRYKIGVEIENYIKAKANLYVGAIDCVEVDGLDILDNSNKEKYSTKSVWLLNFYRLRSSVIDEYDTFLDPSYGIFTAGSVYAKGEIQSPRAIRTNELLNIKATSNGRIDFNDYSGVAEDYLARIMLTSEGNLNIQGNRGRSHTFMKYWMKSPLNSSKVVEANSNSITINHPFEIPNDNYGIAVSPNWNTSWWIPVKNQNGFVISFNTPPSQDSRVDYEIYGL